MKPQTIESLNMFTFSRSHLTDLPFSVYWVSANSDSTVERLNFRNHHHAFCELHFVLDGEMDYEVNGKPIRLSKGEFALIPSRDVHRVNGCSDTFVKLTVAINMHRAIAYTDVRAHSLDVSMLRDVETIFTEAGSKNPYHTEIAQLAVLSLILRVSEALGFGHTPRQNEDGDDRVMKAKLLIEDNTDIFFTCEELAGYCHMSVKQLGRLFKKYEGKGLLQYIHTQKIEAAKRLLSECDLSQKQMAQRLGFSDYRYYSRFFTRMVGMTPSEYKCKHD